MVGPKTRVFAVFAAFFAALCVARSAPVPTSPEPLLELRPGHCGDFTYVANPTRDGVAALRAAGGKPLVESLEVTDEAPALTNWAENASAVAFEHVPRYHLLHGWKLYGVKILKTVRFHPEGSADHFRREASFMAFNDGADGIWLPDYDKLPESWLKALEEVREDWRILTYLKNLADKAAAHPDSSVWIEARRVTYWFGWMPADWENLDVLRLECVAYARRLEQLLGLPAAKLPEARSAAVTPQCLPFMPYADWPEKPVQKQLKKFGDGAVFDGGLSFSTSRNGFSITFSHTNGPALARWTNPGGTLDFRLYVPGDEVGEFLPYRFHCDLDPQWRGERAPAIGREGWLFGTDERFRPYSIAYAVSNPRVAVWPRLRDFGPDYPDPRPTLTVEGNKGGGWHATLSFSWLSFYGHWPMLRGGKNDLWFIGLDRDPFTGKPLAGRILWPRGHKDNFVKFARDMSTAAITAVYKEELARTREVWTTAWAERFYPFAATEKPTFCRYDTAGDAMFYDRVAKAVFDANENAWQLVWTDKEHEHPKFPNQPESIKMIIWQNLGRMLYMSHAVGDLRLAYLEDRFAGREPPVPEKKEDLSQQQAPDEPDVDFQVDAIQLDDKEF